jgi:hypothetical protein
MSAETLERTVFSEAAGPNAPALPLAATSEVDWGAQFKEIVAGPDTPQASPTERLQAGESAPSSLGDIVRSPAVAAAVKWQTRENAGESQLGRYAKRFAAVGGLAVVASAALTLGSRGAQAYAMARHNVDLGITSTPETPLIHSDARADTTHSTALLSLEQSAPSDPGETADNVKTITKGGLTVAISDTDSGHYTATVDNPNTDRPDTVTIVAKQELAKVAYHEGANETDARALLGDKTAVEAVEDAFVEDNNIASPDADLVAGKVYEVDAAQLAAHGEYTDFVVKKVSVSVDNDTGNSSGKDDDTSADSGAEDYDFSAAAERIDRNEGFYATFRQMGIDGTNSELRGLLREIGPELQDRGIAYWDERRGGFWGIRLREADDDGTGYHRNTSGPGHFQQEDLDYIMSRAQERGLLDTNSGSNDTSTGDPTDTDPLIVPVPSALERPESLNGLVDNTLIGMGLEDPVTRNKVVAEVLADEPLITLLRQENVLDDTGLGLDTAGFDRVGNTYVLPPDVRDDYFASVFRNLADDVPGVGAVVDPATQARIDQLERELAQSKAAAEANAQQAADEVNEFLTAPVYWLEDHYEDEVVPWWPFWLTAGGIGIAIGAVRARRGYYDPVPAPAPAPDARNYGWASEWRRSGWRTKPRYTRAERKDWPLKDRLLGPKQTVTTVAPAPTDPTPPPPHPSAKRP